MGSFLLCYSHLLRLLFRAPMAKNSMEWREGLWVCTQWVLCSAQWNGEFDTDKCVLIEKKKDEQTKKTNNWAWRWNWSGFSLRKCVCVQLPKWSRPRNAINKLTLKWYQPPKWSPVNFRNGMISLNYDSKKGTKMNKIFTYNLYSLSFSVIL